MLLVVAVAIADDLRGVERIVSALAVEGRDTTATIQFLIVDNSSTEQNVQPLHDALNAAGIPSYSVRESTRGIPFARNVAVRHALDCHADALILLDDDEWPAPGWLDGLVATWKHTSADIVLGPARAVLPEPAPRWARTSGVFDKDRRLPDGATIRTAYSYNTLLSRRTLETCGPTFDQAFRFIGSSDHDYFKRANATGLRSVWSPHALVYEEIGPDRVTLRWILKRGYRIGVGARRSAQRRLPRHRAATKVVALFFANLGYAGVNALGTLHRRFSWVEGLRRLGIATGLAVGNVFGYQEYARRQNGR